MADGSEKPSCAILKEGMSIKDLMGANGSSFEFNTNFGDDYSVDNFDDLNLASDNEDDSVQNALEQGALISPWTKSFEELKNQMVKINDYLYKLIVKKGSGEDGTVPLNARVLCRYNAYWEGESAPYDSSYLRGTQFQFYTGQSSVLPGLEQAICTMQRGEESRFIISYQLLFGEMGCPPRIKKKADALFIIELVSFNEVGDINADEQLTENDRHKFSVVMEKAKLVHLKAKDFFKQKQYKNASRVFEKVVDMSNTCLIENEEEQTEQNEYLIKLYTNLAVCYNKINDPTKTITMCQAVARLTKDNSPCKTIFQEGRAHLKLGNYEDARKLLMRAHKMEFFNEEIIAELKTLDSRYVKFKKTEKDIWTKAFGNTNKPKAADKKVNENLSLFEEEMVKLIKTFEKNKEKKMMPLPVGLCKDEIRKVQSLASNFNMHLNKSHVENTYLLVKN